MPAVRKMILSVSIALFAVGVFAIVFYVTAGSTGRVIPHLQEQENLLGNPGFTGTPSAPSQLREDGNYDTGGDWQMLLFDGARAEARPVNGAVQVAIDAAGPNTWSVQLLQAPLTIEQGQEYEVEFVAWAEEPREIEVKVGGAADRSWTPYNPGEGGNAGGTMVELSTEPELHRFRFSMLQETDTQARFEFELGREAGDVWLAGARLTPVGTVALEMSVDSPEVENLLAADWELRFAEEFDTPEINRDIWSFETGNGHANGIPGWGNAELQYYTDSPDNAFIRDNRLVIRAQEEERSDQFGRYDYTSARMITQDKLTVRYGRIDVRARLPYGQGVWPAIWMLGSNIPEVSWPRSGEIDIMEMLGHEPYTVHGTIHGPGYSGGGGIGAAYESESNFSEEFHVFTILWNEDVIVWLVDGDYFHHVTAEYVERFYAADWVFNQEFFFILNVAVGGHWPGYPDDTTSFPQEMEIDYLHVYDRIRS
ncbi:beta-glucanase/beta-glucan synthetase [Spirochaeta africana DSM 8902]|uniref:Beta-glucanase/beta-glucan synthetase n=1 Tax=Spirochaeta africana (strain ATCC 700263 / DSM 8902 / Z-7692) TaxID=889378 RepID=H9UH12_SPIAZ|nr:beta-glucanase/beta-glucan synthetase [Spirochaeta africana DSM 8902]